MPYIITLPHDVVDSVGVVQEIVDNVCQQDLNFNGAACYVIVGDCLTVEQITAHGSSVNMHTQQLFNIVKDFLEGLIIDV